MDKTLQPQCYSGALGREEFLNQLFILQSAPFYCLSSGHCELLSPPGHGLGSASDDTALGLPNFATHGKSETLIYTWGEFCCP